LHGDCALGIVSEGADLHLKSKGTRVANGRALPPRTAAEPEVRYTR
jgi:hypothetical protein